jgi:hypothetical protein
MVYVAEHVLMEASRQLAFSPFITHDVSIGRFAVNK